MRQIAAWTAHDFDGSFYLIRLYEGGRYTAARKVDGVYTPEVDLVAEDYDFSSVPSLSVVS